MTPVPVAIIGAGPYGLSLAAHLRARGIGCRIFGRPMGTWIEHMPRGMLLKSEGFASNLDAPFDGLSLASFCAREGFEYRDVGLPVPRDTFVAYGLWFAREAVPDVEDVGVLAVSSRDRRSFTLDLSGGETLLARRVVVATGFRYFARIPAVFADTLGAGVSHTVDHSSYDMFAGLDVAVVGAGQSALEAAALVREAGGMPRIIARAPSLVWNPTPAGVERRPYRRLRAPSSPLGEGLRLWTFSHGPRAFRCLPSSTRQRLAHATLGPAGGWWLRDRVEGTVPVALGHQIEDVSVDGAKVRLTLHDGRGRHTLEVDHVLLGTGYRVDVERLPFLTADVRTAIALDRGAPRLSSSFESTRPGLYFVGFPAAQTFGPLMRFVCGSGFAARRIATGLAREMPMSARRRVPRAARPVPDASGR
jgi:cation diffusion facilitator CzcD-associated flavoprotein CzcO